MINSYKQLDIIDTPSQNCMVYVAQKEGTKYFMYQFQNHKMTEAEQYNFAMVKKIASTHFSHMLCIVEQFQADGNKYVILEHAQKNLLKLQLQQHKHIFDLASALQFMAKIFQNLEQLHSQRFVYRNIRPQTIMVKDGQPYFNDFSLSQFMKRKQRMFDVIGCASYLAPQFFSQDGYGKQVDIWAAGVLFFYMLFKELPFKSGSIKIENQSFENLFKKQVQVKCGKGYNFGKQMSETSNLGMLKSNKYIQDFFLKIFTIDYSERITVSAIRKHPLFQGYFHNQLPAQMLEAIQQSGNSSLFLSKFDVPFSYQLHKQEVLVDFIEHSSQAIDLDCSQQIPQQARNICKFAILKIAMLKLKYLSDLVFGLAKPDFKVDQQQWQKFRHSSSINHIKQKIERKRKVIQPYFKNALINIENAEGNFFTLDVPSDFNQLKGPFRGQISMMFQQVKKAMLKSRVNKKVSRRLTQVMVRLTILHLVNRVFEQQNLNENFKIYFAWSNDKNKSLENLDSWILDEKLTNLKLFMKTITGRYL